MINAPSGSLLVPVLSSAMISSITISKVTCVDALGSPRTYTQCSFMPVKSMGVAQASSEPIMTCTDPIMLALVPLTSQVATEDGDEDFVGSKGSDTINTDYEEAHLASPTIKELFGDLDKSWGNSKDWLLQLHDGRQLVLPLSLYHSLDSLSVSSSLEGKCVPSNDSSNNNNKKHLNNPLSVVRHTTSLKTRSLKLLTMNFKYKTLKL